MEELIALDKPIQEAVSIDDDRITAADDIAKAPYILLIDGVGKMSKGNISAWKGIAKSKKTFALTLVVANLVNRSSIHDKFQPITQKNIGWVDTEQSPHDAQKITKRVKAMCGDDARLMFYCLRRYGAHERLAKVEAFLRDYGEEIDLLVIDGIRDLVLDFNDPVESSKVITLLMAWTIDYDCHISVVLHANQSDGNMRGHLGTELQNKAETVFSVTKDEVLKDVSLIEEDFGRGRNIEPFQIIIDSNGIPDIVEGTANEIDEAPY